MENVRVVKVEQYRIEFSDGSELSTYHENDCCESHYLSFDDLNLKDFDGLEFSLEDDKFFTKIDGYGIGLRPIKGWDVKVPGYGWNNGYYSTDLTLVLEKDNMTKKFDITECQVIEG